MPTVIAKELKKEVVSVLKRQGYLVKPDGLFYLPHNNQEERREEQRKVHELSKAERVTQLRHRIAGTKTLHSRALFVYTGACRT